MKLTYQKCFNLGHYENEVIRLESDEFSCAPDEVFSSLKNAVESLHDKSVAKDEEIRAEHASMTEGEQPSGEARP